MDEQYIGSRPPDIEQLQQIQVMRRTIHHCPCPSPCILAQYPCARPLTVRRQTSVRETVAEPAHTSICSSFLALKATIWPFHFLLPIGGQSSGLLPG